MNGVWEGVIERRSRFQTSNVVDQYYGDPEVETMGSHLSQLFVVVKDVGSSGVGGHHRHRQTHSLRHRDRMTLPDEHGNSSPKNNGPPTLISNFKGCPWSWKIVSSIWVKQQLCAARSKLNYKDTNIGNDAFGSHMSSSPSILPRCPIADEDAVIRCFLTNLRHVIPHNCHSKPMRCNVKHCYLTILPLHDVLHCWPHRWSPPSPSVWFNCCPPRMASRPLSVDVRTYSVDMHLNLLCTIIVAWSDAFLGMCRDWICILRHACFRPCKTN